MAKFTGNLPILALRRKYKKIETRRKKMKRTDYETLAMEEIIVDVENGFLEASVVIEEPKSSVESTGHEIGATFDNGGIVWD